MMDYTLKSSRTTTKFHVAFSPDPLPFLVKRDTWPAKVAGSVEKLWGDEVARSGEGSEECCAAEGGQSEEVGRARTSSLGNAKGTAGTQVRNMIQKAKINSFGKQRRFRIESSDR